MVIKTSCSYRVFPVPRKMDHEEVPGKVFVTDQYERGESESTLSVVANSLAYGLYSLCNSPGQNTG